MTEVKFTKERGRIFTVLSDGKFHTKVTPETEGAIMREFETSDGKKGTKYELVAESITCFINDIGIYDGDYGKQIRLSIGENNKTEESIYLSANSPFGEDFMKKLPNIKPDLEVTFTPFAFEDDGGKSRKGLTIYQNKEKIQDFYHKKEGDNKIAINGYPEIPANVDWDSDDWKLYYAQARKFLIEELKKNPMYNKDLNKFDTPKNQIANTGIEYPTNDTSPEDVPF